MSNDESDRQGGLLAEVLVNKLQYYKAITKPLHCSGHGLRNNNNNTMACCRYKFRYKVD